MKHMSIHTPRWRKLKLWARALSHKLRLNQLRRASVLYVVAGCIAVTAIGGYAYYLSQQLSVPQHGPKLASLSDQINQSLDGAINPNPDVIPPPPPRPAAVLPGQVSGAVTATGIAAGGGLVSLQDAALDNYFAELKALGAGWVRWDVDWSSVQAGGPTSYDWSGPDRIAAKAQKYGIKSLGIITYSPAWARSPGCTNPPYCAPADARAFGRFAGQVAARYKTRNIRHWEVWNEPNYASYWSPNANAAAYTALLQSAYSAIKAADPAAFVLTGGLAPTATENGSIAPITFIQGIYANGAKGSFDAVGMHPYSYPVVPSYQATWNAWQQMSTIYRTMSAQGDSAKKIWATEVGAPTNGPGTARVTTQLEFSYPDDYMTEAAQAQIAQDAARMYQQTAWLGGFFWYSFKDNGTSRDTTENFFGIIRADGSHKPAYDVLKKFY